MSLERLEARATTAWRALRALSDLDDLHRLFVVSSVTTALRAEVNLHVRQTSRAGADRLNSLKGHRAAAAGAADIFFHTVNIREFASIRNGRVCLPAGADILSLPARQLRRPHRTGRRALPGYRPAPRRPLVVMFV
jgi:hypothetical protein